MKQASKVAAIAVFVGAVMLSGVMYLRITKGCILPVLQQVKPEDQEVAIQAYHNQPEQITCNHQQEDYQLVVEPQPELPVIMPEPELQVNVSSDDYYNVVADSFMTMQPQDCVIDTELYQTLDSLMGKNLDEFVRLVLQSNNNIVSKQACRSCSMYAFFNKIKRHEPLSIEEIAHLQSLLKNLYRFIEKMQKLSKTALLRPEQWQALQELYRSQDEKNQVKIEQRKAITAAALRKLRSMKYKK